MNYTSIRRERVTRVRLQRKRHVEGASVATTVCTPNRGKSAALN